MRLSAHQRLQSHRASRPGAIRRSGEGAGGSAGDRRDSEKPSERRCSWKAKSWTTRRANRCPARIYIRGADGTWHFPKSAFVSRLGGPLRAAKLGSTRMSVEMHTTLSAHPFRVELLPGRYTFTIERGKEYFPETREVVVESGLPKLTFRLRRWVNMSEQGWFSGDTHNHRDPPDLPNVMLAEDVNVGLPMVDWTTASTVAPSASGRGFRGDFGDGPVPIDATHVWHPRNTEYEIFRTGNSNHTLGRAADSESSNALRSAGLPAATPWREKARAEGALLDLEKHNWPWSLALVPLLEGGPLRTRQQSSLADGIRDQEMGGARSGVDGTVRLRQRTTSAIGRSTAFRPTTRC